MISVGELRAGSGAGHGYADDHAGRVICAGGSGANGGFDYSTFREHSVPPGETALGDFLTRTRKGHCEYFATAAT
ncbi:MAG: hypothetical protein WAT39_17770, partial [Planctomycetota bacterium]